MNVDAVRKMARKMITDIGSQTEFARRAGLPRQHVSLFLKGGRAPADGILKALGLVRVVDYRRRK